MLSLKIVLSGPRLNEKEVSRFRMAGFLHVTGLEARQFKNKNTEVEYLIGEGSVKIEGHKKKKKFRGAAHCSNNGKTVIVARDGTVWLGTYDADLWSVQDLAGEEGAFVPCSNMETPSFHDVLRRVSNTFDGLTIVEEYAVRNIDLAAFRGEYTKIMRDD